MTGLVSTIDIRCQTGSKDLSYEDFWNIAGRAGRTLLDTLGVVAFPATTNAKLSAFQQFLQGEANIIASQLVGLIEAADEIANNFNLNMIEKWPALSSLMQFLAHALHVSGRDDVAEDVEDILRASLVYYQVERSDPKALTQLVSICQSYLQSIRGERGIVALSEQTGFATPSVLRLLQDSRRDRELSEVQNWDPSRLFGNNINPLTRRIEAIAELPEIRLGAGQHPPFNAQRVAAILRDWIRGDNLKDLTRRYLISSETDESRRIGEFSSYLFSQLIVRASWGLGALETVSLAGTSDTEMEEAGYVPSMTYFGVDRKEAVWLRMAGVPRVIANSAGELWRRTIVSEPGSFQEIRNWISDLSDNDWRQIIPSESELTPREIRSLCSLLVG